jgi:NAD(P)-dependent dehydrogenase (short-subunit alcohol dehydrogenase family)
MPLEGKVALVTGASKGVGKGIALELARAGCDVVINYNRDQAGASETVKEILELGRRAVAISGDVSRSGRVDCMFDQVLESFGRLDILVNNAGVQTWKPLLELAESDWDSVMATNLKGCCLCTQRAGSRRRHRQYRFRVQ